MGYQFSIGERGDTSFTDPWEWSYGGVERMAVAAGLDDLMGGCPCELIPDHDGAATLTSLHLVRFRDGLARTEAAGPRGGDSQDLLRYEHDVEGLRWLVDRTERALATCIEPTLHNR